jgi:predicted permease
MDEEMRVHLDMETQMHIDAGMSPRAARRQARLRFGSVDRFAEEVRDARGVRPLEDLGRDIRIATRALRKRPGYAAAFVVTLGLGIGANTAIFSVIDGVLLTPLPHQGSDQLVYLRHAAPLVGVDNALFSVPEIIELRERSTLLGEVAELSTMTFTVLGLDEPRLVRSGIVTGNYFGVMGLRPELGRTFSAGDDGAAATPVMLLGYDFWGQVFGFDPTVVGRTFQVNGRSVEIVGVLTPAPPYPERTDIFVNMASSPHHLEASMTDDWTHRMTEVFARVAPDATLETVATEVSSVAAIVRGEHPEAYDVNAGYDISVTGLQDQLTSRARPTLWILLGTAAFVLVIACANVANLTLTRVVTRERELATRAALGATRRTLRRALLIENLLLAVVGAGVGVGVAWLGLDALVTFIARLTNRATEIALDGRVLGFATAIATLAALVFATLPRLPHAGGTPPVDPASGRTTDGKATRRVQRGLVVAQVAVSFVLLAGAGLLGRTLLAVQSVDPGFQTDSVLTMEIPTGIGTRSFPEMRTFYEEVLRQVRAVPGVQEAAVGTTVPFAPERDVFPLMEASFEDQVIPPGQPVPRVDFRPVSQSYFRTLGIQLLSGRSFDSTDGPDNRLVVVVNRSLADRFFPNEDPIDRRLSWADPLMRGPDPLTIVGVVENSKNDGLDRDVPPAVFLPFAQFSMATNLFVRTSGDAQAVASPVRAIIRALDPTQPIENVMTLERIATESVAPRRLNAALIGGFALLALTIAAVGVFSVMAFSVTQRTREFGIRSALGARRADISGPVFREGLLLAGNGLVLGGAAAAGLSRSLQGFLFGVSAIDPVTFLLVGLVLAVVAGAAAWLPARRAAHVDPVIALRAE